MKPLEHYQITKKRGYLCTYDASSIQLENQLGSMRNTALSLPNILPSGRVREILEAELPTADSITNELEVCSEQQLRMAMVHYSFMVQSYVWGEPQPSDFLPSCLAQPIYYLAQKLGQQPLLPYSGYVLDNWAKLDPAKDISLDNIYMIQNFLGGQDEAWFVLIHVAIEAKAGAVLAAIPEIIEGVKNGDTESVRDHLEKTAAVWEEINSIFDRMPERCDPYIYFERVRPYIHGWRDNPALPNGVIYEGVEEYGSKGRAFRGQTGSQSSIVPAMDALMGVGHANDPLKEYLDQLHIYRPPNHREFIDDIRIESNLRNFVSGSNNRGLIDAYNGNVNAVAAFRSRHLEYAASYIAKQNRAGGGNDTEVGTGGTPFMKYLKKHREETKERLIAA